MQCVLRCQRQRRGWRQGQVVRRRTLRQVRLQGHRQASTPADGKTDEMAKGLLGSGSAASGEGTAPHLCKLGCQHSLRQVSAQPGGRSVKVAQEVLSDHRQVAVCHQLLHRHRT